MSKRERSKKMSKAGKESLKKAKAGSRVQNVAVMYPQYDARVQKSLKLPGRDNLTFDAIATLGTNFLGPSTNGAVAVSASGYITVGSSAHVLNQVPQGTTATTRIGRKIKMTKLRIKGQLTSFAGNTASTVCRLALVYIPKLDRTTTTMAPHNVIWTAQHPNSQRFLNNSDRFKVLREWVYVIKGDSAVATNSDSSFNIDEMVDVNRKTSWTIADVSGTFDDMEEGALCLYGQSTQTSATPPKFDYTSRLYFEE